MAENQLFAADSTYKYMDDNWCGGGVCGCRSPGGGACGYRRGYPDPQDENFNSWLTTWGNGPTCPAGEAPISPTECEPVSGDPPRTYSYDAAGNIFDDDQGRTYGYNQASRLFEVYEDSTLKAAYTYNAFNQRTRKVIYEGAQSEATLYHYDVNGNLIAETDDAGTLIRAYVWHNNEPIAQITKDQGSDTLVYLHTDHLATPRTATDAAGTTVWRWDSNGFGATAPDEDPDTDSTDTVVDLRFPGQYFDAESGFHYNWNRYYDPNTGRYITSDPIGLRGGLNTYSYVGVNPLTRTDPTGEYWKLVWEGCKWAWKWIKGKVKPKPKPKPKPKAPDPGRASECERAFRACLGTPSIPESTCFAAYSTCISTKGPMIFPGYGVVR